MKSSTSIRSGRHCVFLMHVHLVFVTKYRRKVFSKTMLKTMKMVFEEVCDKFEASLVEFNGESDHVHLLINHPPKVAVSRLVNSLKGVSSRILRRDFPSLGKNCLRSQLWSSSYFAGSCGGAPLTVIKQYIENQTKLV